MNEGAHNNAFQQAEGERFESYSGPNSKMRNLLDEVPVSMVFDGTSAGVMMATPCDVRDLAHGFAITEGIISDLSEIQSFEVAHHNSGLEARFWLNTSRAHALAKRRRVLAGPVGCGLCGIDSLEQAVRSVPQVKAELRIEQVEVARATQMLREQQPLHDQTGAAHAAGFLVPRQGIVMVREDLGRHNALDKLIGALRLAEISASHGAFVMTSRLSLELVQKCAMAGGPMLIAVSAPTLHAVNVAATAGITVAAFARNDRFEVFTHPERILSAAP